MHAIEDRENILRGVQASVKQMINAEKPTANDVDMVKELCHELERASSKHFFLN